MCVWFVEMCSLVKEKRLAICGSEIPQDLVLDHEILVEALKVQAQ